MIRTGISIKNRNSFGIRKKNARLFRMNERSQLRIKILVILIPLLEFMIAISSALQEKLNRCCCSLNFSYHSRIFKITFSACTLAGAILYGSLWGHLLLERYLAEIRGNN